MTEYTLQIITLSAGRVTFILFSEFAGLTIPAFATLLFEDDELAEAIDIVSGEIDLERMQFAYLEDYSTYQEGFWYKVLDGDFEIKILLDEGSGDTVYFWGTKEQLSASHTEISLVSGYERRTGTFSCISKIADLKEVFVADLETEMQTHLTTPSNPWAGGQKLLLIKDMFASLLTAGGLNSTYDNTDVSLSGTDPDYKFYVGINTYSVLGLGMTADFTNGVYFRSVLLSAPTAFSFLAVLCDEFDFVPRFYYDIASSRWKILLLTRGYSHIADNSILPAPMESDNYKINETIRLVQIVNYNAALAFVQDGVFYSTGSPQYYLPIDINKHSYFYAGAVIFGFEANVLYANTGGTAYDPVDSVKYWDYGIGGGYSSGMDFYKARAQYLWGIFGTEKRGFDRTYKGVASTISGVTSHDNLHVCRTTIINDGVEQKYYYAQSVNKSLTRNTCTVKWVQVE